jgi:hypothetical protein
VLFTQPRVARQLSLVGHASPCKKISCVSKVYLQGCIRGQIPPSRDALLE